MEESPAAETDWVRTALRRPMDPLPRFVVRASSSGLTDLEREALHGWRRFTAGLWRDYTAELGVPAGAPETLPWQSEEEPEPVSLRQLHRWAQAARRSRWPLLREVVAETFRTAVEPESIDRLPLPSIISAMRFLRSASRMRRRKALVIHNRGGTTIAEINARIGLSAIIAMDTVTRRIRSVTSPATPDEKSVSTVSTSAVQRLMMSPNGF